MLIFCSGVIDKREDGKLACCAPASIYATLASFNIRNASVQSGNSMDTGDEISKSSSDTENVMSKKYHNLVLLSF